MIISEQEVTRLLAVSPTERFGNTSSNVASDRGVSLNRPAAQVDISATAQEIQRVKQLINRLPDVREDRVQALKAQIESGSYNPSGQDIADLIIRRALADNTGI
jgi:negative regulator of flagellin synthesis FlgM